MNLYLQLLLILYLCISYIVGVVLFLQIRRLSTLVKRDNQPFIKVSLWKVVPVMLIAPVSLPLIFICVLYFKNQANT